MEFLRITTVDWAHSQFAEFPMNEGCAPQGVDLAHAPMRSRMSEAPRVSVALPRLPGPVRGKDSPVPADTVTFRSNLFSDYQTSIEIRRR